VLTSETRRWAAHAATHPQPSITPKTFPSLAILVPSIEPLTGLTWMALLIAVAALVQRVLISWPFVKINVIIFLLLVFFLDCVYIIYTALTLVNKIYTNMSKKYLTISECIDRLKEIRGFENDTELAEHIGVTRQDINQLRKSSKIDPKTKIINDLLSEY
jgi:hypothetical protein